LELFQGQLLRVIRTAAVMGGVLMIVFAVARIVPGDPAVNLLGEQASEDDLAAMRTRLGLDQGIVQQFVSYMGDIFDGTLGHSFRTGEAVSARIARVFPYTLGIG